MDGSHFDDLTRSLSGPRSRRGVARLLGGLAFGGVLSALGIEWAAADELLGGEPCMRDRQCQTRKCLSSGKCSCSKAERIGCVQPANRCKKATCSDAGRCVIGNKAADTPCNDGFACTTDDVCDGEGHCAGTPDDSRCTTTNRCLASPGRCDPDDPKRNARGCVFDAKGDDVVCRSAACLSATTYRPEAKCDGNGNCAEATQVACSGDMVCDAQKGCRCPDSAPDACGDQCFNVGESCNTGLPGVCATGTRQCDQNDQLTCVSDVMPGARTETCNGLDDDCDGNIDNGAPCNGDLTCINGECACAGNKTKCGNQCFDTQTNDNHCGDCDTQCSTGEKCINGTCQCGSTGAPCPTGETCTNGACVCGSTGASCPETKTCINGTCDCTSDKVECQGVCQPCTVDITDDGTGTPAPGFCCQDEQGQFCSCGGACCRDRCFGNYRVDGSIQEFCCESTPTEQRVYCPDQGVCCAGPDQSVCLNCALSQGGEGGRLGSYRRPY